MWVLHCSKNDAVQIYRIIGVRFFLVQCATCRNMRWNGHLPLISLPTFAVLPVSFSHCGYVADLQKVRILSPCVFHFHIFPFASFSNILKSIPFIFTSLDPRSDFNKSTLAAHVKIQAAPIIFELHAHLHVDGAQLHVRPSCVHAWHM